MDVFDQLWQPAERFNQIVPKSDRVRRGEADPLQPVDFLERFEQLDEGTFPVQGAELVPAIEIDDLTEQGHFFDPLIDQDSDLVDDFLERPASFVTTGIRYDAECAMHVAA